MTLSSLYPLLLSGKTPSDVCLSTCLNPNIVHVTDFMGQSYDMPVPCGHCIRCRQDAINQWYSRMMLHSLYYKHCYFVTLTYGSYDLSSYKKHPFKKSWLETYPVLDSNNELHRRCYTPSILVKTHLQSYLKRLRKCLNSPITYAACGEYGKKYGRPHFHLIIWSNNVISNNTFSQAWSLSCTPSADPQIIHSSNVRSFKYVDNHQYTFRIGNVYVVDLVANGSLNYDDKNFRKTQSFGRSGKNAFKYVAKYVQKRDAFTKLPMAFFRLKQVYKSLEPLNSDNELILKISQQNEKFNLQQIRLFKGNQVSFRQFQQLHSPYFVSSRATGLGKNYFIENAQRFLQGNFSLPRFFGQVLSFPKYFLRLLSRFQYPLRFLSKTLVSSSFVKYSLPAIRSFFVSFADSQNVSDMLSFHIKDSSYSFRHLRERLKQTISYLSPVFLTTDGTIRYEYSPTIDSFIGYSFSRRYKEYYISDLVNRKNFCTFVLEKIDKLIREYPKYISNIKRSLYVYNKLKDSDLSSVYSNFENYYTQLGLQFELSKKLYKYET